MSESFIYVKPSSDPSKVKVLTELLGELEIPVYIGAHPDGTLIDENNPLPTDNTELQKHSFSRQEELLEEVVLQLRLLNKYMAVGHDEEFDETDLEEY